MKNIVALRRKKSIRRTVGDGCQILDKIGTFQCCIIPRTTKETVKHSLDYSFHPANNRDFLWSVTWCKNSITISIPLVERWTLHKKKLKIVMWLQIVQLLGHTYHNLTTCHHILLFYVQAYFTTRYIEKGHKDLP